MQDSNEFCVEDKDREKQTKVRAEWRLMVTLGLHRMCLKAFSFLYGNCSHFASDKAHLWPWHVYSLLSDCTGWQHGNTHSPQGCGGLLSFPMSSECWNLELPLCTGLQCRASTCSYKWLQHLSLFWKRIFGSEQDILESHNSNAYGMWLSLLANMNLGGKRVQTTSMRVVHMSSQSVTYI